MTRARVKAPKREAPATAESALALVANDRSMIPQSREFMDRIAAEVFRGVVTAIQGVLRGDALPRAPPVPDSDVMNADEVAEFLGVDRTTVYDFAGRGAIPHQRLGKRLLFRRGALVSWLDSSLCKATSTRKAG
nr:helix-turn-helix domain-containing protein [Kofleriaceae bacterium]